MSIVSNISPLVVYNTCTPKAPKNAVVPLLFTTANQVADIDLLQALTEQKIEFIQSIYVDNSQNATALSLYIPLSQQPLIIPARHSGYLSLLVPNPPRIVATSLVSTDTAVTLELLNFPVSNIIWNTDPTFSQSPLVVTDATLDALLANGYLPTLEQQTFNLDQVSNSFVANRVATGVKTATGSTTLLTPTNYFRVGHVNLQLSGDASLAAPGVLTVQLRQNTTVFATFVAYLPGAAGTPATPTNLPLVDQEIPYWSSVTAETLNINFSAALATGTLAYTVMYGETAIIRP